MGSDGRRCTWKHCRTISPATASDSVTDREVGDMQSCGAAARKVASHTTHIQAVQGSSRGRTGTCCSSLTMPAKC